MRAITDNLNFGFKGFTVFSFFSWISIRITGHDIRIKNYKFRSNKQSISTTLQMGLGCGNKYAPISLPPKKDKKNITLRYKRPKLSC